MNPRSSTHAIALFALFASNTALIAQDGNWNNDSNGNWSDTGNWNLGTVADGTDFTAFLGDFITNNRTITLDTDRTIGNIIAQDTSHNYTISGANTLTFDTTSGSPTISVAAGRRLSFVNTIFAGNDGLTLTGAGVIDIYRATFNQTGGTIVDGGAALLTNNNLGSGNWRLNNGVLSDRYRQTTTFTGGLGAGDNQIQMFGVSGFGGGNGNSNWRIGAQNSVLQWGSTYFNPTTLQFQSDADNMGPSIHGTVTLQNGLDLNGGQREINVYSSSLTPYLTTATIDGVIEDTAGGGGFTKTGEGRLIIKNTGNSYSGPTILNGGILQIGTGFSSSWHTNVLPSSSNLEIQNGIIDTGYYAGHGLGSDPGQVQITGGRSGFSNSIQPDATGGTLWRVNDNINYNVVWGATNEAGNANATGFFNPNIFVLNEANARTVMRWQNPIDLNASSRTVEVASTGAGAGRGTYSTMEGAISNSSGTAGLIKAGAGTLMLRGNNTYNGGSTISAGTLWFDSKAAMPASGQVNVNDGTVLAVTVGGSGWDTGTSGNGSIGGLLAGDGGQSGSTVAYSGNVGLALLANGSHAYAGNITDVGTSLSLIIGNRDGGTASDPFTRNGSLELSGNNSFTGGITVYGGSAVTLSSDHSSASGGVSLVNGYLQSAFADLISGGITFASTGNGPAILQTSGSIGLDIGSGNDVYWSENGGFAATDSALSIDLNSGATIDWSSGSAGFRGKTLQLGSTSSTAAVTLTNDITLDGNRAIRLFNNANSSNDVSILSGNIVRDGSNNRNLTVQGSGTLVLSGTNEFGTGQLQIDSGAVVRAIDGTGLPTGAKLYFNGGVFESSGTFTRNINNSAGDVYWNNSGGFAANGGALNVNLEGGADLTWGSSTLGFRGRTLNLGSQTADDVVTLQNNITLDGNRTIQLYDNASTSNDISVISGNIVRNATTNRNLTVRGNGTLVLSGTNEFGTGQLQIDSGAVVRAIDGTGLPTGAKLYFNGGVFESSGTFTRNIANSATNVYWNNNGGFAANGGTLDVNLNGGATINWASNADGFNGRTLILGTATADNVVTLQNNIELRGNRTITVNDNSSTSSDYAVISGSLSNGDASNRNLTKNGDGTLVLAGTNTYSGSTTVSAGTLAVNGSLGNTSSVSVASGAILGGSGIINANVTINAGGTLATGNSIESLASGNLTMVAAAIFAYEMDNSAAAAVAGDLTAITGNLSLHGGNGTILTLTELGAGAWSDGDKLTLISYSGSWNGGLFDYMGSTLNDGDTINLNGVDWTFDYDDTVAGTNFSGDLTGTSYVTMTAAVIPEPSTALLCMLGILGLLVRRRR